MTLHIGYAQNIITPALDRPVFLAGFGRNRRAVAVHDELYARALALDNGIQRVILVALDLIGLARHHCQEIESQVCAALGETSVIVACTHTHHGPDAIGLWGPDDSESGVDVAYLSWLKATVCQTAVAAAQSLAPIRAIKAASVAAPGVVQNFRDPHLVDDELTCVQFQGAESNALATLLVFPCHPEVLWDDNPVITSDYVHSLRQHVEQASGGACIVFVGALGGMLSPLVNERTFAAAEQMGRILGHAALTTLALAVPSTNDVLFAARSEYAIPMENPLFIMAMERGLLPNVLNERQEIATEANLVIIGDAWFACNPGELFPRLGLAVKRQLLDAGAGVASIIGLANDELGYILPEDEFVYPADPLQPGEHYEESMSVGIQAAPAWRQALNQLLQQYTKNSQGEKHV